jgi:hypothetical protein
MMVAAAASLREREAIYPRGLMGIPEEITSLTYDVLVLQYFLHSLQSNTERDTRRSEMRRTILLSFQ